MNGEVQCYSTHCRDATILAEIARSLGQSPYFKTAKWVISAKRPSLRDFGHEPVKQFSLPPPFPILHLLLPPQLHAVPVAMRPTWLMYIAVAVLVSSASGLVLRPTTGAAPVLRNITGFCNGGNRKDCGYMGINQVCPSATHACSVVKRCAWGRCFDPASVHGFLAVWASCDMLWWICHTFVRLHLSTSQLRLSRRNCVTLSLPTHCVAMMFCFLLVLWWCGGALSCGSRGAVLCPVFCSKSVSLVDAAGSPPRTATRTTSRGASTSPLRRLRAPRRPCAPATEAAAPRASAPARRATPPAALCRRTTAP